MSKTMIDHYRDGLGMQEALGYDDWKNQNKGKLKMTNGVESALDVEENQAMYKLYQQEIQASNAKNEALADIEKNRAQALRENAVLTERAKEYAAKNAALRGVSNSGISQTSMIDLMSQMAGVRADTQAQYDNQKQSVLQEYMNAINQAKSAASDTVGNVAIQKAAKRESDEATLRNVAANHTTKLELEEAIKAFERKYGEGSVPSDVKDAFSSEDASPGQVKAWIDIAKSDDYYDGKTISVYDESGKLYTKNNEDDSSSGFDLDDFENRFENKVLRMVAGGAIKNGDVIRDTTYSNANYVYLDGNFYKITNDAVEKFGGKAWDVDELEDDFFEEDEDARTPGVQNKTKKSSSQSRAASAVIKWNGGTGAH